MQWDATRPLEGNCELQLYTFDQPEGKETFWHSSSHVLGETLEQEFGVQLCHGPPTDSGFFYDSYTGKDVSLLSSITILDLLRQKLQSYRRVCQKNLQRISKLHSSYFIQAGSSTALFNQPIQSFAHYCKDSRERKSHCVQMRKFNRSLHGSTHPKHQNGESFQSHEEFICLLARRCSKRQLAACLRHFVPKQKRARRIHSF